MSRKRIVLSVSLDVEENEITHFKAICQECEGGELHNLMDSLELCDMSSDIICVDVIEG